MVRKVDMTAIPRQIGGSREELVHARMNPALGALKRRRNHRQFNRHEDGFWSGV